MATYATLQRIYLSALVTNQRVGGSGFFTVTVQNTSGFQLEVPIEVAWATASSDATVDIFRSCDGGLTYDTLPMQSISLTRINNGSARRTIPLPNGQFALKISAGGGSGTASVNVNTPCQITAVPIA